MASLAIASWPLGEVDRAISLIDRMQTRIAGLTHVGTLAFGRMHAAMFELMRGDHPRAAQNAFELARLAREHDLNHVARVWSVSAGLGGRRRAARQPTGSRTCAAASELLREQNVLLFDGLLKIALAEAEARAGDLDRAIAILDEALATSDRTGYRAFEAELHRARGEILLKRDPANPAPAEEAFLTAIAVAKQQGTRSFELRAALSLAKLYQSTGRPADAHAVLAPRSKAFRRRRKCRRSPRRRRCSRRWRRRMRSRPQRRNAQRRLHLQTAYGQAMMWSKGFAAEETKAAFARAAELAGRTDDFSERFSALRGQWAAAITGGELRSARELALTLLREAEDAGRVTEAGIANRRLGLIAYWRGDFVEARTHCERALDARDPNPDPKMLERFGDVSTYAIVTPRRDHVAIGRGRTRARIDRLGQPGARPRSVTSRRLPMRSSGNRIWKSGAATPWRR